ncbi:MAG: glycosyltransferase family 4 protein [Spirulinaceae cyanobacterium SM2_1_0]|nr:glycosyltransferase family 4 protein [Spirulinaceae cyanobacterium SM2_1_0]
MNILLYSPLFAPSVGGVETVTELLARELARQGHTVQVVCQTPALGDRTFPFPVIRRPLPWYLLKLVRRCDVFVQICISLKGIWAGLLMRRPLVFVHQTWYRQPDQRLTLTDRLKLALTRWGANIAVSPAIAAHLPTPATVIPNPYDDSVFRLTMRGDRPHELIFVGRLVSDKGVDLLIAALERLRQQGLQPHLTIVGAGPEASALQQQVADLELTDQVTFAGLQPPEGIAALLNQHAIAIFPSRWPEPFGIVALEAIACGCVAVGSAAGGLATAIGPGGVTFANGDLDGLTAALVDLLTQPQTLNRYRNQAATHLQQHQLAAITRRYLAVFEEARS